MKGWRGHISKEPHRDGEANEQDSRRPGQGCSSGALTTANWVLLANIWGAPLSEISSLPSSGRRLSQRRPASPRKAALQVVAPVREGPFAGSPARRSKPVSGSNAARRSTRQNLCARVLAEEIKRLVPSRAARIIDYKYRRALHAARKNEGCKETTHCVGGKRR